MAKFVFPTVINVRVDLFRNVGRWLSELGNERKEVKGPRQFGHHNLIDCACEFGVRLSTNLAVGRKASIVNQGPGARMAYDTKSSR